MDARVGRYPGPVEFTASRRSHALLTALGVVLIAGAVALIVLPPAPHPRAGQAPWVGWLGLVIFVPATAYLASRTVRPRVSLRLDADGFVDTSSASSVGRIGWDEVIEARAFSVGASRVIGVLVSDPDAVLRRLSPVKRAVAGMNRGLADTPVWISAAGLPMDEVARTINAFRDGWAQTRD